MQAGYSLDIEENKMKTAGRCLSPVWGAAPWCTISAVTYHAIREG
jgi:hypothetical protein